jgi:hypothetical protein
MKVACTVEAGIIVLFHIKSFVAHAFGIWQKECSVFFTADMLNMKYWQSVINKNYNLRGEKVNYLLFGM